MLIFAFILSGKTGSLTSLRRALSDGDLLERQSVPVISPLNNNVALVANTCFDIVAYTSPP